MGFGEWSGIGNSWYGTCPTEIWDVRGRFSDQKTSKNVKATIVEGYGRKIYKAEYLKFLVYSLASNDETKDHLENLYHTKSLQDHELYNKLHAKIETLGKQIRKFYHWVDENHKPSL